MLAHHGDVDLGVLVLAEVVLQRLESLHELRAGFVGQQAAEALQQVAELLGVLAEVVHLLRRGVGPDQPAAVDQDAVRASDALARPARPRGRAARPAVEVLDLGERSASHAAPVAHQLVRHVERRPRSSSTWAAARRRSSRSRTGSSASASLGAERVGVTVPFEEIDVEVACGRR